MSIVLCIPSKSLQYSGAFGARAPVNWLFHSFVFKIMRNVVLTLLFLFNKAPVEDEVVVLKRRIQLGELSYGFCVAWSEEGVQV